MNKSETSSVINSTNKYGYEWGGFETTTNIIDQSIGTGLTNTNSLIELNLRPYDENENWNVLWNKVVEFRQSYTNKWFVPSFQELEEIYNNKENLTGLTTINIAVNNSDLNSFYWSSSEYDAFEAYIFCFSTRIGELQSTSTKDPHFIRCRLCRQI